MDRAKSRMIDVTPEATEPEHLTEISEKPH